VTIAIIDTGVDLDHPDLAANIISGWDFVSSDNNPDDDHGHGTHVAGIAAAVGNNGLGIAGVSWGANIMPLKVLDSSGSGSSYDVAQAIYYAVNNGARIVNMSLGARGSSWPCYWTYVEDALNYAVSRGVLVVVAAGNDSQYGVNCPGAYDQVMAVGATTSSDARSSYSNYGPRLDIAAPGDSIYSALRGGNYGYKSGTSMATPHVAGLAALIWSLAPSFTDQQVRSIIESTANDLGAIGWDQYYGYGRINVANALGIQVPIQTTGLYLPEGEIGVSSTEINIPITTYSPESLNWSATIDPAVTWLAFSSPNTGTVSAISPAAVTLQGIFHPTYEETSTNVVITATSASGGFVLSTTTAVQRFSHQYYLPLLFKNSGP
jgi:subtilisin family serine protease